MMNNISIIYTACPTAEIAQSIVKQLIDDRLIACGNVIASRSNYFWAGELQSEDEYIAICKTLTELVGRVEEKISEIHPYEVPAILNWSVAANPAYAQWVEEQVNDPEKRM